jgi:hypothetical protein
MMVVHNVQVYPVYAGHVNDHKVIREEEFNSREDALMWVEYYNQHRDVWNINGWLETGNGFEAVYTGAIDAETGENL